MMKPKKILNLNLAIPLWWPSLPKDSRQIIKRLLPTAGNMIFTVVLLVALLYANRAGALTLFAPNAPSTQVMPYQGRLAGAGGSPLSGNYAMTFALYDVATSGVPLWTETWTGPNSVTVRDGLFNVALGSLAAIPQSAIANRANVWLGITVGSDTEMSPRVQLGSVPFAVQALTVPDGSITQAKFAPGLSLVPPAGSITTTMLADGAVTAAKMVSIVRGFTPDVRGNTDSPDGLHRWAASGYHRAIISFKVPDDYVSGDLTIREAYLEHDNNGLAKMSRGTQITRKSDGVAVHNGTVSVDYNFIYPAGGWNLRVSMIPAGSFAAGDLIRLVQDRSGDDPADTAGRLDLMGMGIEYLGK